MPFIVSGDRLFSSNRLDKLFISILNKIVLSTSPCFRPIVVRKFWLILCWCIRGTYGDLYLDLIISSIFPINPILICTKSVFGILSQSHFESTQRKCINTFFYLKLF